MSDSQPAIDIDIYSEDFFKIYKYGYYLKCMHHKRVDDKYDGSFDVWHVLFGKILVETPLPDEFESPQECKPIPMMFWGKDNMCFMFRYNGTSTRNKSAMKIINMLNIWKETVEKAVEAEKKADVKMMEEYYETDETKWIKREQAFKKAKEFAIKTRLLADKAETFGFLRAINQILSHTYFSHPNRLITKFDTGKSQKIFIKDLGEKIYNVCIYADATFLRNSAISKAGTREAKQTAAAEKLISETIFPELPELPERKLQELIYCGVGSANAEQDFCILSNIISTKQLVGRPMFFDPYTYNIRDYTDPTIEQKEHVVPISPLYMHWVWIQKISPEYLQYYDTPSKVPYTFRHGADFLAAMKISKKKGKNAILVAFQAPSDKNKLLAEMVECTHDEAYWTGWSTLGLFRTPLSFCGPKRKEWTLSFSVARTLITQYTGWSAGNPIHTLLKLVVKANKDWITYESSRQTYEVQKIIRNIVGGHIQKVSYYKTLRF